MRFGKMFKRSEEDEEKLETGDDGAPAVGDGADLPPVDMSVGDSPPHRPPSPPPTETG